MGLAFDTLAESYAHSQEHDDRDRYVYAGSESRQ